MAMKETKEVIDAAAASAVLLVPLGLALKEAAKDGLTVAEITAEVMKLVPIIATDKNLQGKLIAGVDGASSIPGEFKNAGVLDYVELGKASIEAVEQVIVAVKK